MSSTFSGYQCWKQERIGRVIAKAALDVDREIFLATHVPIRHITYEQSPMNIPGTSESEFLDELNRQADQDQHTFAVVRGIPGTGKSHFIRWLQDRFEREHPTDIVLLIERANTSLKETIQQIIQKGAFDSQALSEQLKRLESAVDALSKEALADSLLNHLQVATYDVGYGGFKRRWTPENLREFLLDVRVREALKASGGPVERITRFLTAGAGEKYGVGIGEIPGFEPQELIFDTNMLRQMRRRAYRGAFDIAQDVAGREDQRDQMARYLNHLLHTHVISRMTNLSAADLRQIFNDLRRHLRTQGQNLALFIEDITSFTGIDAGLIDVLITEHRGEANREFCRLTSVVGITDAYYQDRLPQNVRERISHLLTLNSGDITRPESELLRDEDMLAEFAARYLNAIRLPKEKLEQWHKGGASPDALPNGCADCVHRTACHQAFDKVNLLAGEDSENIPIGLYPFNRRALKQMYDNLQGVSRTPRTLLADIIAAVMQSHGNKVSLGSFPPPARDLANHIKVPEFDPPAHGRIIEEQGGNDSDRLKTLFLYWGNRSVNATDDNGIRRIGGMLPAVFDAFKLPRIDGRTVVGGATLPQTIKTEPESTPEEPEPQPPSERTQSQYTQNITDWANGGTLYSYDRFTQWIAGLVFNAIDWQVHGISQAQVRAILRRRNFAIEDQSGSAQGNYLLFKRSSDLQYALQALADLEDSAVILQPEQYGEHLTTLSRWLRQEEPRIVAFVRETTMQEPPPDYLPRILIQNAVLMACLEGKLQSGSGPVELFEQVVASCMPNDQEALNRQWQDSIDAAREVYPTMWISLMRTVNHQRSASICRYELLQQLNCQQGDSLNVLYLDAASAIQYLEDFNAANWSMPLLTVKPVEHSTDPVWQCAVHAYETLRESFEQALSGSVAELRKVYEQVMQYLGDDAPDQVFEAIPKLLTRLQGVRAYSNRLNTHQQLSAKKLVHLLAQVEKILTQDHLPTVAMLISDMYPGCIRRLRDYAEYFEVFIAEMDKQKCELDREIGRLGGQTDADEIHAATLAQYVDTLEVLDTVLNTDTDRTEVQAT